jgi:hypothetical protein
MYFVHAYYNLVSISLLSFYPQISDAVLPNPAYTRLLLKALPCLPNTAVPKTRYFEILASLSVNLLESHRTFNLQELLLDICKIQYFDFVYFTFF